MQAIYADGFKTTPLWWEDAAPTREGTVALPDETDVLVVGGGYAGLSTALELARNGTWVTVLEAEDFGHGASTRNGGQVSGLNVGKGPSGGSKVSPTEKALGPERMQALLAGGAEAMSNIEALIEREAIDCHYRRAGRFVGAYTPAHFEAMRHRIELANAGGDAGAELLPPDRQREEIGSDFYCGGARYARSGLVHPALLHRGLYDACRRYGVTLCAGTAMRGVARDNGQFVVATSSGSLKARHVVAGTNGYTGKATPWLRRRLIPAASYVIATEAFSAELGRELVPNGRGLSDSKRVLNYFRLSPDGRRMVFGGRAKLAMRDPREAAPILYRQMTQVFPQLAGSKLTHAWTGGVAFTFDFLPHMGTHDGVHYMAGCNGSGVAMMTYLGTQTARKILGQANRPCVFDGLPFPGRPGYTGWPWFLPLVSNWYALRDRIDRARA